MQPNRVVHCKRERFDVYIGRPGKWGNPLVLDREENREQVLREYRRWLDGDSVMTLRFGAPPSKTEIVIELKGKILGCWCAPKSCHGDILAEIANEPTDKS